MREQLADSRDGVMTLCAIDGTARSKQTSESIYERRQLAPLDQPNSSVVRQPSDMLLRTSPHRF
jgi:hypothetical protein